MKIINIATILPYKENYTFSQAQAAAIWVCDFFKFSKHKNTNYIFGNTKGIDYLSKNYININISNLKSKFSSSTNEYCKNFIKKTNNFNFDIIEIHNRPLVFNYLKKKVDCKYIIYFHNDPLSMSGSKWKRSAPAPRKEWNGCICSFSFFCLDVWSVLSALLLGLPS